MKQKRTILPAWRKAFAAFGLFAGLLFLIPGSAWAIIGIDEPLIPCGLSGQHPCGFCDFFALVHNIYNFIIFVIVPPVAVLMVAIAGFRWLTSGGNPAHYQRAMQILRTIVIGLLMVYISWLFISFGIRLIARDIGKYNPAVWYDPTSWFKLQCSVK